MKFMNMSGAMAAIRLSTGVNTRCMSIQKKHEVSEQSGLS